MSDAPKDSGPKVLWKIFLGLSSAASALAARQALHKSWRFVTGSEPPKQPNDPDVPWPQAFGWALGSLVALEGTRLLVVRRAARYWRARMGALPELPEPPGRDGKKSKKKAKKKKARS